ncbi:MAG: GatB/YqeY domain-containing protein [Candidatus Pacebacteria bacterium]|jgi:hypothetical protein|nr:GatB/YqeY domain-containing protein [Candidatus Paceibacterota bacterium]
MLHEQIKLEIKEAMLAKEQTRLDVLRGLSSAFTNELIAKGRKPQELLPDAEALAVIMRSVKQRKDSIEQFLAGGRADLANEEEAQLAYLVRYMPELLSREEVMKVAEAKKIELGIIDSTKKGMLMSALMKDLKGKADGVMVKEVVDALFN